MSVKGTLFALASGPLKTVLPGVQQRELARGPLLRIDQFFFEQGATGGGHSHPIEEAGYIIAGEFEMKLGDEARRVGPGDSYSLPANTPHAVKCLKAGTYILVKLGAAPAHDHDGHDGSHSH